LAAASRIGSWFPHFDKNVYARDIVFDNGQIGSGDLFIEATYNWVQTKTTLEYFPGSINWTGTLTSIVAVSKGPTTKDDCKKNGWKAFGFRNQGQCVSYVNHLP